ncbi:MAG TPA: HEAT repeat domain-containing protein [Candidatus Binataceae bacterium]|nr:HEAT repeat domain-containing protein [Candidatus Binataceae bacterium]
MIPDGTDKPGHSLKMLLQFAIKQFPGEVLFDFVLDKDSIVRTMAARRLQNEPDLAERTFAFACTLAQQKRGWQKEIAAFILGQLCPPNYPFKDKSIPVLNSLAKDPEPAVRGAAIVGLGHLGAVESKELVLIALNDPDPGVVGCASYALWALGKTAADVDKVRAARNRFDEKARLTIDLWEDRSQR